MNQLEALIASAKVFQATSPLECSVMICDAEGVVRLWLETDFLKNSPIKPKVGDHVPPGGVYECLKTGKLVREILPKEAIGIPVKGITSPVFDEDGRVIGAFSINTSLEIQEKLNFSAQTLAATSQQISASVQELTASAQQLASDLAEAQSQISEVKAYIDKSDKILGFVSEIAADSNILGLNAAIEAARAGEQGRGFAVVAEEIRKMAVNSAQSVQEIKSTLQTIQGKTSSVGEMISKSAQEGMTQAVSTGEIGVGVQQLAEAASLLEKIAEKV